MASCLKRRTSKLLSQKPRILSSFFAERWFGMLAYQDHLAHKTNTSIIKNLALIKDGLTASFSTFSDSTNELVEAEVSTNIPDEKDETLQDQSISYHQKPVKIYSYNGDATTTKHHKSLNECHLSTKQNSINFNPNYKSFMTSDSPPLT
ncbi:unnamed protein product [Lactuca virosa]|uniref:Uncharacterized protein n=1 Tax=Lactuca virosa TaxID=75947 RepID=A0AAU9LUY9_9ASTR|nr:unnamed protein product [Lactuca virosa]